MDNFVKNFIAMSMTYLVLAGVLGVIMLATPEAHFLRFAHSHLMLLGWVSMMIYGVGYHILPRFAGKLIENTAICEVQFWLANIGLVGMVVFRSMGDYSGGGYRMASAGFGAIQIIALAVFFYTMVKTVFITAPEAAS